MLYLKLYSKPVNCQQQVLKGDKIKDYRDNYVDVYRDDDSDREFFELLAKLCQGDENGTYVSAEPRIELVKKLFQLTKLIFQGADTAKLEFGIPFHGMGVISLEGRNLKMHHILKLFQ